MYLTDGIKQICSNCRFINEYTKEELEKVFPYSREKLKCRGCGHVLSICSGSFS